MWALCASNGTRMFVFRRRNSSTRFVRAARAVVAIAFVVTLAACESTPIRAFRGARHYAAGTEALDRNEDVLAIAELERAAELVPHASEIQNHLGIAYWSDGRLRAAQVAFEKAIELDCDNVVARANLERLMRSDDEVVEARAEDVGRVDENGE